MFFNTISVTALLAATGLVAATPLITERQATITPPDRFYLQTKVVGDQQSCGTDKDGLWVWSYHTGAGLSDAVLSSNKSYAVESYQNGTEILFVFPNEPDAWPLNNEYGPYQGW